MRSRGGDPVCGAADFCDTAVAGVERVQMNVSGEGSGCVMEHLKVPPHLRLEVRLLGFYLLISEAAN